MKNSVLDLLKREDYSSEEAYMHAAAILEMQRNSPEYKAAMLHVQQEMEERQAKAVSAENERMIQEELARTTLSSFEEENIKKSVTQRLEPLVKAGKLSLEDYEKEADQEQLEERKRAIERKARNSVVNRAFHALATGKMEEQGNSQPKANPVNPLFGLNL